MSQKVRLLIAGTREFNDYDFLRRNMDYVVKEALQEYEIEVISGTARGADRLGERWAADRGYKVIRFPADWDQFGKRAGMIRNQDMVNCADYAVYFWDGTSPGTKVCIDMAKRKEIPVLVIEYE